MNGRHVRTRGRHTQQYPSLTRTPVAAPTSRDQTFANVEFALHTSWLESPCSKPPSSRQRATVVPKAVLSAASEYTTVSEVVSSEYCREYSQYT
eukprot:scaffold78373_cov53-Phaeocystis_antarctica.AAC.2